MPRKWPEMGGFWPKMGVSRRCFWGEKCLSDVAVGVKSTDFRVAGSRERGRKYAVLGSQVPEFGVVSMLLWCCSNVCNEASHPFGRPFGRHLSSVPSVSGVRRLASGPFRPPVVAVAGRRAAISGRRFLDCFAPETCFLTNFLYVVRPSFATRRALKVAFLVRYPVVLR